MIKDTNDESNYQTSIEFSLGRYSKYQEIIFTELSQWKSENKVSRLWNGDATLWTGTDEKDWLGWLDVSFDKKDWTSIQALSTELKVSGIADIVVLGMGGSSLCAGMFAHIFGKVKNNPQLHILDSTDPMEILTLESRINLQKTFFIVSSKSGTTLEVHIFKNYFYNKLQKELKKKDVGHRFLAITDPGTKLAEIAKHENFRDVFYGIPSIGGRYSALSNFGMVPLGLMGVNVKEFLDNVKLMHHLCSPENTAAMNPGLLLGVILAICGIQGHDKITFITSHSIHSLGTWLEQLIAESTGKLGKGLIPINQEPLAKPETYGDDRIFIQIKLEGENDQAQEDGIHALEQAGFIVIKLVIGDKMHLGAELFLWEFATAVAGSILGINPFNQPDVEESKILAQRYTSQFEIESQPSEINPFFTAQGLTLYADDHHVHELSNLRGRDPTLENYLQNFLQLANKDDYINLVAFIAMSEGHIKLLQECRVQIRDNKKLATCLCFGPRFLHSTGQAHKGGQNTGVFLQITADPSQDIQVPGCRFTFGLVIKAQAHADFNVLTKRDRRILRIHLGKDIEAGLKLLIQLLKQVA